VQGDDEEGYIMATLLWIACGACSGESMAILGVEGPGKAGDNLLRFLEQHHVQLLWHPSLSLESPQEVLGLMTRILAGEQELTLFCVEGRASITASATFSGRVPLGCG
jgi:hydrogenase small subunit